MQWWQNDIGAATRCATRRGFTLVELLLATAVFAMLASALFGVFRGAMKLREQTYARIEDQLPVEFMTKIIERDLACMVPPNGNLMFRGDIYIESQDSGEGALDEIEFFTSSAVVTSKAPWGDTHKIEYYIEEPEAETGMAQGFDFVRVRTPLPDNLVGVVQEPEIERYFLDVQSLDITWYDGETWQETLDTSTQTDTFPEAVKLRITFIEPEEEGKLRQTPIEILVAIPTATRDTSASTTEA